MDTFRALRLLIWVAGFAATTAGSYYAMDRFDFGPGEDKHGFSRTSDAFAAKEAIGAAEEYQERYETARQTGEYNAPESNSFE